MTPYRVARATACLAVLSSSICLAETNVVVLDLTKHLATDKADLRALDHGEYEWSLPTGAGQSLTFDLPAMGIDTKKFDEIRFDLKPLGSQVGLNVVLRGHPAKDEVSGWYLKFKAPAEKWSSGRFDLHLDDDGIYRRKLKEPADAGKLTIRLYRRILGYPGEPVWRKAIFRNVRLVKRLVSADFSIIDAELVKNAGEVACVYPLRVRNTTAQPRKVNLDLDSAHTLKHFQASAPFKSLELKPGEEKVVPVKVFMPATQAMRLPSLYSEPLIPEVSIPGIEDSDVIPLKGYRRWPMWGVVPVFHFPRWNPPTFQAFLEARQQALPGISQWRSNLTRSADTTLKHKWPTPDCGPPLHDQIYRCKKCKCWLKPITPTSLHHHHCPKCKEEFVNNDTYDRAWLMRYNSGRARDIRNLAFAWLATGQAVYAEKAMEILLDYAEAYPTMPISGTRSTSGGSKLGANTLHSSYVVPVFAEGYYYLSAAPCLDEEKRDKIVGFLKQAARNVIQHSVEYNNQQAEHFRAYGSVGLATEYWPLAAEAVYGDFGYHELVEFGYSEDGIAHEAGGYHRAVFHAMSSLATFAYGLGINLYTPRFKRVFDGSLAAGFGGFSYELAYRVYGDPAYIPVVSSSRKYIRESAALHGMLGLPDVQSLPARSVLMPGAGYVYLRKGTAADWLGISLNYIKPFDRHETDRFTTFFYQNGTQVDSTVGRITYGSSLASWMYATAAHNTIVIDGKSQAHTEGRLLAFDPSPTAPVAVVTSDPKRPFYEGVSQLRGLAIIEDVFLVFDRVVSDKARTIDRYQYGKGSVALKFKTQGLAAAPPSVPERGNFSEMVGGNCGKELRVDFGNGLKMRLVSDGEMEAFKAVTIGGYQAYPMEVTFARRAECQRAVFLAAFSLGSEKEPPELKIVRDEDDELRFEVKAQAKTYAVAVLPSQKKVSISE